VPTYSYECKKCSHIFELFHGINATPKVKCTECGGATKRLMGTGGGIIFKGSGFYETDYKTKTNGGAKEPKEGKKEGAKESSSGGESKPAAEAAPKKVEKSTTPKKD
jgi:putative FmdB family regulatory protein